MSEYTLVEKPILEILQTYDYEYIKPSTHHTLRERENEALLKPILVDALMRINGISEDDANTIFHDLSRIEDNERWLKVLRGNYSRRLPGDDTHRTIRVVDFDDPANNHFSCTNQLRIQGEVVRKPDVVCFLNGIPVVIIEAKSPLATSQNTWDAVDQVKSAEKEVPRLFHSNLFNIATNDVEFLYGTTGAPREFWFRWPDPWPKRAQDFRTPMVRGLYALLEPSRLLDLLAHFIVFEKREGKTSKKICRYQQFRGANKMVQRVLEGKHKQGLIWHTQGSGKSLTMVFAALKLKFHRGIHSDRLENPNLMVLTDRKDLDKQITATFLACGLPNPRHARSKGELQRLIRSGSIGQTVLSTIFKFHKDTPGLRSDSPRAREKALDALRVPDSDRWIIMVDEAHRTQEEDLGAFLRATLPQAVRFGFTGTPVKKNDHDTYENFGVAGEAYLDKYSIDDAVADGATIPIRYQGRMTEWHLYDKELDILFDQWFANEPDDKLEELKRRGVTKGDLARLPDRIRFIANDIWAHFQKAVAPDGFKAQIVAIDRLACVAYKKALEKVIARTLKRTEGLDPDEALERASKMSVCVYSPSQHDKEAHPELVEYQLDEDQEKARIEDFLNDDHPLSFLIVCNKLLTGFDAPVEQALYLDNPLSDHTLLQAIARTNRRHGPHKKHGLIVDYIGVSHNLSDALSAYRQEDIRNALRDVDELKDQLRAAHADVMEMTEGLERTNSDREDALTVVRDILKTEDKFFDFRTKAKTFIDAYTALSPDPATLAYQRDLKFVAVIISLIRLELQETREEDYRGYSEKIREMLEEHLEVTGLKTACKLRSLDDPVFWKDFDEPSDLHVAAVRKLAELKKVTTERTASNPAYDKFSDRVKKLIKEFNKGQLEAAELLKTAEEIARGVYEEDQAYKSSGLTREAHGIWQILTEHKDDDSEGSALKDVAQVIASIYASDDTAPMHWQDKAQLRKELRQRVRKRVHGLGLADWKKLPKLIDEYAVKHYAKS